jgi:hypothetical protein
MWRSHASQRYLSASGSTSSCAAPHPMQNPTGSSWHINAPSSASSTMVRVKDAGNLSGIPVGRFGFKFTPLRSSRKAQLHSNALRSGAIVLRLYCSLKWFAGDRRWLRPADALRRALHRRRPPPRGQSRRHQTQEVGAARENRPRCAGAHRLESGTPEERDATEARQRKEAGEEERLEYGCFRQIVRDGRRD